MADSRARTRLEDILDEIEGIRSVTAGLSFAEFDRSWATLRATQHALLIIAEAVKNLPPRMKAERPEIPWERIRALGNFLTNTRRSTTRACGASLRSTWTRWRPRRVPCLKGPSRRID